ncbi:hypothetical protein FE257_003652 [Aspergillus nanangensis]|uniref:Tyrosinase copper-binding domain-containing protein n=1 Tax=Aspergillus nanangensis TaxID=2582783 RepID=A0AAD4GWA3_ASPNN|nr:hypothetical protein FE257_003652 [Aspergillus nanangensis]
MQKAFGTNYGLTAKIPKDAIHITKGIPKEYVADNGSGATIHREFCPQCGSFILEYGDAVKTQFRYVCVGSLDDPDALPPKGEFFCNSRAPWMPAVPSKSHKPYKMYIRTGLFLLALYSQILTAASSCEPDVRNLRYEWGELGLESRMDYTRAIQCMKDRPPVLSTKDFPGVRSRYDDFAATHINYTLNIHFSGTFLAWHRHYIWLLEKALRDECGYNGSLPYWNWARWPDLAASPLFDGSETSLSGDGEPDKALDPVQNARDSPPGSGPRITVFPPGTGGGCVKDGPFRGWIVNFGPFKFVDSFRDTIPPDSFDYKPHCLFRSLNNVVIDSVSNQAQVDTLLAAPDIIEFRQMTDAFPDASKLLGLHGGGHLAVGQIMFDAFASPQDPVFWLHHGMLDRLWSMWQHADEGSRRNALNGSNTIFYRTNTPEVTLDTVVEFGVLDKPQPLRDLMSPRDGRYCYLYS